MTFGLIGVAAALLFRVPALLVLASPFVFIAVWSTATRPPTDPSPSTGIAPTTVREGEGTTWTGRLRGTTGIDHIVAFAPERDWLVTRPRSGVVVVAVDDDASSVRVELPMRATHWGHHEFGPVNLAAVSAWGAFRWSGLDIGGRVTALPLPDVFDAAPSMQRFNGLVGVNRSVRPGDGNEFSGIRAFQTGDRLRRINWRRSLRSGELQVTATLADTDTHVALVVDAFADVGSSGGVDGAASSLDTTVRATGAIAEHFLGRGDRVSMSIMGTRYFDTVPPANGARHLRRILDVLASIESDNRGRPVRRSASPLVPGGALVIMLSPLISPLALERAISIASHGISVAVIDTMPADIHRDDDLTTELAWRIRLLERRREMRAIQRLGVPISTWRGPGSLDPFLHDLARRASAPRMARR